MPVRFLHLADTHVGARHPGRGPGDPFVRNLRRALAPAREGRVDLVLHGGDLFHRSRPPPRRLAAAAEALVDAAEGGAEVVIVPGNHERSVIPARLLLGHPRIHVLEVARRVRLDLDGLEVAVFGFPFVRKNPRARFEEDLRRTGWPRERAAVNVLLCHLTLDGATVGPADFTFRNGPDVIPRGFIPADLDYAALGHIHRHQFLPHPRNPYLPLAYPGSTERTSRAERHERKGFLAGEFRPDGTVRAAFRALPAEALPPAERRRNWTVLSR